ncbi:hypothetical protein AB0M45_08495 [Nocardia sp. NPDC051787]|uniref:hypothetical protein n=1 Tax=Nocardia sp. NPDC051787 TaxID=3155415 RepID=UPI0034442C7E
MTGRWRIAAVSSWDRNDIDLVEPGFIEFGRDGTGQFGFIAVRGWLDSRPAQRDGRPGVEFIHLFFHLGDDSSFRAKPFVRSDGVDG